MISGDDSKVSEACLCVFQPKQEGFVSLFLATTLKTEASNRFLPCRKEFKMIVSQWTSQQDRWWMKLNEK